MKLTLTEALQKGVEAHKSGKAEEADQYYTAILKAQPKHPDANHNMGVLAVGVGKVEQSLPFFKTALEANPKIAQFWLSYIDALIKLDRIEDAKSVFDQAKSTGVQGDGFDILQQRLGLSDFKEPNVQELSQDELKSLIELYNRGKLQQVFKKAQILTKRYGNSLQLWNLLGTSAAQIEKPDEAIHAFQKAASLEPRNAQALYNMGKAMIEQGKLEEATESFSKAISLKPDYAKAYNNMGAALQAQGKLNEAIEAYTKAVSINPDFYDAYYNLGNALREQGKLKEAIEAYNKTLAIKPDSAKVIVNASSLRNQILDSSLINEEFEERLETPSLELSEEPKFPILQAIRAFLLSDQKLVRKHLRSYTGFTPSSIAKLVLKDQVFCSAYNIFLQKLIETPFENKETFANDQTVFHLGESHCLSYAHKKVKIHGIDYNVAPRITFGAKAYHFSIEKENAFKAITKANFDSPPDNSTVFISFGEIDCRPNEGFFCAASKLNRIIEDLVSDTTRGYVGWFAEQNRSKNHSLFFLNVPAPFYNDKYTVEVNKKVKSTIKFFNSLLQKTVADYGFNIIDVYKFTVDKDGFSNGLFHIDKYHLSSHAVPEIEKQIGTFL